MKSIHMLLTLPLALVLAVPSTHAQESRRGRKYKSAPATSHIEVEVLKDTTGKPILNAAVIFHAVKDGKDEGNLEVKTNDEGRAVIDVIATGSAVDVQVIADGFSTYAQKFEIAETAREIKVRLVKPRAQISAYVDNSGKASGRPDGVQEANHPNSAPVIQAPRPTNHTSDPNSRVPLTPGATPGNSQNGEPGNPPGVPPQL